MDALALLCTLHADGPSTLRILRQSGCDSLDALTTLEIDRLAQLLDQTPASTRRFQREARNLRARLGDDRTDELLEREEAPAASVNLAATGATRPLPPAVRSEEPRAVREQETAVQQEEPTQSPPAGTLTTEPVIGAGDLASNERTILDRVLTAWREHDDAEQTSQSVDDGAESDEAVMQITRPALRPGSLDGLTEECCRRLAQVGVDSIAELLERDPLELAQAADLHLTLVQRLQFLARRDQAERPLPEEPLSRPEPAAPAAAPNEKISLAENPLGEAGVGWDFELLPRSVTTHAPSSPLPRDSAASRGEAAATSEGPADAAGPFA